MFTTIQHCVSDLRKREKKKKQKMISVTSSVRIYYANKLQITFTALKMCCHNRFDAVVTTLFIKNKYPNKSKTYENMKWRNKIEFVELNTHELALNHIGRSSFRLSVWSCIINTMIKNWDEAFWSMTALL